VWRCSKSLKPCSATRRVGFIAGKPWLAVGPQGCGYYRQLPFFAPGAHAMSSIYDFEALSIQGKPAHLSTQRGKVLLIVNTASQCGFTPQFAGLEALWKEYADRGLVIVGFPSNQFGGQDPGSNDQIASFCEMNYGVSFPMMAKVEVNGANAHPLWKWLTEEAPGVLGSKAVKWNFTKFLVGRDGQVIKRYAPTDKPESLKKDIEAALAARP
jgi:glutathione peroxidase